MVLTVSVDDGAVVVSVEPDKLKVCTYDSSSPEI